MRVYRHSGVVPVAGAATALAAGAAAAVVLGVVYSFTFYYIPYVYLNFLLAVGFGAGVGYITGQAARAGKIRNVAVVGGLALLATLFGIYAEWGSTAYAMCPTGELPNLWNQAGLETFLPHQIVGAMFALFAEGSWGLTEGSMVKGWPLVALWLLEAGLIIGLALMTATKQIADSPFCEQCQRWVAGQQPHYYVGDGSEPVWNDVMHGTFETLAQTPRAAGNEPTYVRLSLGCCEGCSESNFVTITACKNTTDAKGNPKLEENGLVTNLILQPTQVEIIQAANLIAPEVGSSPLELPSTAGNWTLQSTQPAVPLSSSGKS